MNNDSGIVGICYTYAKGRRLISSLNFDDVIDALWDSELFPQKIKIEVEFDNSCAISNIVELSQNDLVRLDSGDKGIIISTKGIKVDTIICKKNNRAERKHRSIVSKFVGKQVAIVNLSDCEGQKPTNADCKYIGEAYKKVVTITHKFEDGDLYLTDFFMPQYIDENNDYVHYGYLKLLRGNFKVVQD